MLKLKRGMAYKHVNYPGTNTIYYIHTPAKGDAWNIIWFCTRNDRHEGKYNYGLIDRKFTSSGPLGKEMSKLELVLITGEDFSSMTREEILDHLKKKMHLNRPFQKPCLINNENLKNR